MWIRAVIIGILLCLLSGQAFAQDLCTYCENSGCLESFEKAKSESCQSCQICLGEETADQPNNEDGSESQSNEGDDNYDVDAAGPVFGNSSEQKNPVEVKDCARKEWENDASCKDLNFQERMAISAEDIIGLNWWQLLLSTFSLLGLGLTIVLTHKAVKEAREANRIARESNKTTEMALSRDRAWFLPTDFESVPLVIGDGVVLGTNIFCKLKNSGNSPAIQINVLSTIQLGPSIDRCLAKIDKMVEDNTASTHSVIGPNETCITPLDEVRITNIGMILQERKFAVYAVIATYRDIFDLSIERVSKTYQRVTFVQHQNAEGRTTFIPIFESIPQRADTVT